jgi:hypothetical protein
MCHFLYFDVAQQHFWPALKKLCTHISTTVDRFFIIIKLIDYKTLPLYEHPPSFSRLQNLLICCRMVTSAIVCLFVWISFIVPSLLRSMWTTNDKGNRLSPLRLAQTKEILHPQRALCAILGVWVPLTNEMEAKIRNKERQISTARAPPCSPLLSLPYNPLVHFFRMGFFFVFSSLHQPPHS